MLSASAVSFFSGLVLAHLGKETCSSSTAKTLQVGIRLPPYVAFSLSTCKEVVGWRCSCSLPSLSSSPLGIPRPLWAYLLGGGQLLGCGGPVATGAQRSCALACSGLSWYYSASATGNIELAPSLLIILQKHSASALAKKWLAVACATLALVISLPSVGFSLPLWVVVRVLALWWLIRHILNHCTNYCVDSRQVSVLLCNI